jgi:hypothetical protein
VKFVFGGLMISPFTFTENAAFCLTDSYLDLLNKKCTLEEFSVIWQSILIA